MEGSKKTGGDEIGCRQRYRRMGKKKAYNYLKAVPRKVLRARHEGVYPWAST